jgi:broad specificity phosphatase PhoE
MSAKPPLPVLYLARHGETVFNRAQRMQGQQLHTPLTHAGITQAHAMGAALQRALGVQPDVQLWASTAGRAQQTAAIVAEHLQLDFFKMRLDARLQEINVGSWEGRSYAEVIGVHGSVIDPARKLFSQRAPGGEWYDDIARRLESWLDDVRGAARPQLVIAHGISARVLRGLLVGGAPVDGTPVADDLPQGTMVRIENGAESAIIVGSGSSMNKAF